VRTFVFLDLDDTILQTAAKCPAGESISPVAFRRDGEPASFMTERQQLLFTRLIRESVVIPTTGRNLDAFCRVRLPFSDLAILDFGGVVLLSDGTPDPEWDAGIRTQATQSKQELCEIQRSVQHFITDQGLGATVRTVSDFGMDLYLVLKHSEGRIEELRRIRRQHFPTLDNERFFVHQNGNNLSVIPRFLGKERAVQYVLERQLGSEPSLTIGVADSFTDSPFLGLCDYILIPRGSQLLRQIVTATGGGDVQR
jgi:hypothetical protein